MISYLPAVLATTLGLAPAGAGVGVGLEFGAGFGLLAGSLAYGLVAGWALAADIWPDTTKREAIR